MPLTPNIQKRKRILIIDDEKDMTLLVRLNLQRTGRYEVKEENDPSRALTTARLFQPDLVLLDVMMPEMDGGDVLALFKEDANLRNLPVIFLTATVLKEEIKSKGGTIGGYPCIPKPFQMETLIAQIDKTLGGTGTRPTAGAR